jgi:hypothetical protein
LAGKAFFASATPQVFLSAYIFALSSASFNTAIKARKRAKLFALHTFSHLALQALIP